MAPPVDMQSFENKPVLGGGIYTVPDIAQILRLSINKASRWIKTYWDEKLGKEFDNQYSWYVDQSKAVNFHTLIELYIFHQLNIIGIKPREVLKAHKDLSERFGTQFPFANENVLKSLNADGRKIYFEQNDQSIVTLDNSNQLNLDFIRSFFKFIDFDDDALASRFWPLGKAKSIVCDPDRQFGHAVIENTNIYPDTIYSLHIAGEPTEFIASLYGISKEQVENAIEYCMAA
ncbi:hypothetical protein SAMN00120144_2108 [Hymenobacter roseosalivarius DSM 11622]|uniref:DUF433 domain-containing protein n=1 Tax=Hymenobacter roseosalivarius DSM 11622 TaxID=645990 RepID=A0A1W1VFU1_9BACT|nr:DUF433 domain-containing protein [Hymenobacter roseosalivarius]SMB92176.1 hypothetical protein SAMN00120144_2108 [Hymenobacter roseosalivarius DSM 11622]